MVYGDLSVAGARPSLLAMPGMQARAIYTRGPMWFTFSAIGGDQINLSLGTTKLGNSLALFTGVGTLASQVCRKARKRQPSTRAFACLSTKGIAGKWLAVDACGSTARTTAPLR